MPEIRPSADLRNSYTEISDYCHSTGEPVYITRNGRSDLVVISSEAFDRITARMQDYQFIEGGAPCLLTEEKLNALITKSLQDIKAGRTAGFADGMAQMRKRLESENV